MSTALTALTGEKIISPRANVDRLVKASTRLSLLTCRVGAGNFFKTFKRNYSAPEKE